MNGSPEWTKGLTALAMAILMPVMAVATGLTAAEGVATLRGSESGAVYYNLWNPLRTTQQAILKDTGGMVDGYTHRVSRFLCRDTGVVSNSLPVFLVVRAMPSSDSIPATRTYYAQGPDLFSGEGHTVVGSDVHNDPDMDHDGVPDAYESTNGSNPALPDTDTDADGDGHPLSWEYVAGTDPQDPASVLRFTRIQPSVGADLTLTWSSVAGKSYQVQGAPSPAGPFTPLGGSTSSGPESSFNVPGSSGVRIYRLTLPP